MEYLKRFFRSKTKKVEKRPLTPEEKLAQRLKPFQRYLFKAQDIVTWEEPAESALAVCLVNVLFWFLSYVQWRFYGLFFTVLCLIIGHEAWVEHIWPEIKVDRPAPAEPPTDFVLENPPHSGVLTVPEISHYATGIRAAVSIQYAKLRHLRTTQPPLYCAIVSAGCLLTAGIGTVFSGMTLIYLATMLVMTAPGIVKHLLPPEWKRYIFSIIVSLSAFIVPPEGSMEEYMPESNHENLSLLNQAGENYDLSTPTTEDSSIADLLLPGHDESSVDTLDSLALPTIPQAGESSSDTDSEIGALKFKSSHFNGAGDGRSSSTDEDSSLLKDLNFPDVQAATSSPGIKDVVTGVLYKTFPKAFSSSSRYQSVAPQVEDSDSEFEIIDNDDTS